MSDSEPIELHGRQAWTRDTGFSAGGHPGEAPPASRHAGPNKNHRPVFFDRRELDAILRVYGQMVAAGEWRDYAIDQTSDEVTFSVFRRTSEMPLYRIVKTPRDAKKQGAYRIVSAGGLIVKRGHDLARVLKALQKKRIELVSV